jgi:hypothetical protein
MRRRTFITLVGGAAELAEYASAFARQRKTAVARATSEGRSLFRPTHCGLKRPCCSSERHLNLSSR